MMTRTAEIQIKNNEDMIVVVVIAIQATANEPEKCF